MKGACDSHCCEADSSLADASSIFWLLALVAFLFSLSDLSWAASRSLAMTVKLLEILCIFW